MKIYWRLSFLDWSVKETSERWASKRWRRNLEKRQKVVSYQKLSVGYDKKDSMWLFMSRAASVVFGVSQRKIGKKVAAKKLQSFKRQIFKN